MTTSDEAIGPDPTPTAPATGSWVAEYDAGIDAGRIAYLAGQPETDCPHIEPSPAREGWLDGYHLAQNQARLTSANLERP